MSLALRVLGPRWQPTLWVREGKDAETAPSVFPNALLPLGFGFLVRPLLPRSLSPDQGSEPQQEPSHRPTSVGPLLPVPDQGPSAGLSQDPGISAGGAQLPLVSALLETKTSLVLSPLASPPPSLSFPRPSPRVMAAPEGW